MAYEYKLLLGKVDKPFESIIAVKLTLGTQSEGSYRFKRSKPPLNRLEYRIAGMPFALEKYDIIELFKDNPENLFISKEDYDHLMEIWKSRHLHPVLDSDDVVTFIKSLRTPEKYLEVERKLDSFGDFSINFNGTEIFLESSFKERVKATKLKVAYNLFDISYGTPGKKRHFSAHQNDEEPNFNQSSLSKREVLSKFTNLVSQGCFSKVDSCQEIYADSLKTKNDLKSSGISNLIELRNFLVKSRSNSDFAGIIVEDVDDDMPQP